MAFETLKTAIQNVIKSNDNNEITGPILQAALINIINTFGTGYMFLGMASKATVPIVTDTKVYYIATESGIYSNFSGIEVTGEYPITILYYNGGWLKWDGGVSQKPGGIIQGGTLPVSQSAVYDALYGGINTAYSSKSLPVYTGNFNSTLATVVLDYVFSYESVLTNIQYNGYVSGNIIIRTYSRSGNNLTLSQFATINISIGENNIDISALRLKVPAGGMVGFTNNDSSLPGRFGYLNSLDNDFYSFPANNGVSPLSLPAKGSGGFGIKITYNIEQSINGKLNSLGSTVQGALGQVYLSEWVAHLGSLVPDLASNAGYITLNFTSGNQSIYLPNILPNGQKRFVSFSAKKLIGSDPCLIVVGIFTSVDTAPKKYLLQIDSTEKEFKIELEGNSGNYIALGMLAANNSGQDIAFKDFTISDTDSLPSVSYKIDNLDNDGITYRTEWVPQLGGVSPNLTLNPGYVSLNFTSGNQSVYLQNVLPVGQKKFVSFSAKKLIGSDPCYVVVGIFSSSDTPPKRYRIQIEDTEKEFAFELEGVTGNNISFGMLLADNGGQDVAFKDFKVSELDSTSYMLFKLKEIDTELALMPQSFFLESVLNSVSRYDTAPSGTSLVDSATNLIDIAWLGDSLLANDTGGPIPGVEAVTRRPLRLGQSNTLARRFYDAFSWNKPQQRRLDDSDFTKTGTWTQVNTTNIFEPIYASETYHYGTTGADAIITIPSGNSRVALRFRMATDSGTADIYVNGVLNQSFNSQKLTAGHTGNPYKKIIISLDKGISNTIRVVCNSANGIYYWGCFYWDGVTMNVDNVAHGGHHLKLLLDHKHIDDEVIDNDYDAIFFEHTLMNDTARMTDAGNTIAASQDALRTIYSKLSGKDILSFSCHPYGLDPRDLSPNYFTAYPGMQEMKNALKQVSYELRKPYIDVFDILIIKLKNAGFDPASGQQGILWTWDGQHQNELGMLLFWLIIYSKIYNIPLKLT